MDVQAISRKFRAGFMCLEALGGSLLEAPIPTLKFYNLHALTVTLQH